MINHSFSKDGVSIATILDTRRKLANGLFPIKVRVTYHRERTYYPTGKSMTEVDWERLNYSRLHSIVSIRRDIENSFDLIKNSVEDLTYRGVFSIDMLNTRLKGAGAISINTAIDIKEKELRDTAHISSANILRSLLLQIKSFSNRDVKYEDVSVVWLKKFESHLRSQRKSQTTIAIYLRALRQIFNNARDTGIIKLAQYPFGRGKYEIQEGEGRKLALTLEQIGQIARFDDGLEATAKYRDYWLFLYFCNGINVADFVKLRYSDIQDGQLCYIRQKTVSRTRLIKRIRAVMIPQMDDIIKRWGNKPSPNGLIFPILSGNETVEETHAKTTALTSLINRKFRYISKELNLPRISTYTARHSFATVLKRAGANIAYISESLGHSDIRTTENYLASFEREEREKNARLLTQF
ncbi:MULTISPECIES: site-specific integrase [Bacteroidales]|uniref:site-specific integrase n=1 Tax=Bacteroidales TaxID=171549 RepID=UPI0025B6E27F|nr:MULTISPECIES: site-specific integrase [Bacteroidales]